MIRYEGHLRNRNVEYFIYTCPVLELMAARNPTTFSRLFLGGSSGRSGQLSHRGSPFRQ